MIFSRHINRILELSQEREDTANMMIQLGNKHPLYEPLQTIPGIGPILAIFLIAEMGDLDRFDNGKQLVEFAGLDPIVYQSGTYSGLGLHISKKGNKHLRKSLFQAISTGVYVRQEHPIKVFFERKKPEMVRNLQWLLLVINC